MIMKIDEEVRKHYIIEMIYRPDSETDKALLMELSAGDADRKGELYRQVLEGKLKREEILKNWQEFHSLSGPMDLYLLPQGKYNQGDVLDTIPESAVLFRKDCEPGDFHKEFFG
ncbi:hypothetical protein KY317_01645 [Candidatus Woesearchaeota archaeon]|nr:hypothetical protein [Candidatus Woesearchaeota archaeon]